MPPHSLVPLGAAKGRPGRREAMKRLIWLLVLVAAAYSVNEVRTKGVEGAFGGVLEGKLDPIDPAGPLSVDEDAGE
jgi:hypothetical protein